MKTTKTIVVAAMLGCAGNLLAQENMKLTTKEQALVAIAANEARGDMSGLKSALSDGFNGGLTVSEAKEALSQLYAYTGFPRSLNALGALQQVLKDRESAGLTTEAGREADALPKDYDACARALRYRRAFRDSPSTTRLLRRPTTT